MSACSGESSRQVPCILCASEAYMVKVSADRHIGVQCRHRAHRPLRFVNQSQTGCGGCLPDPNAREGRPVDRRRPADGQRRLVVADQVVGIGEKAAMERPLKRIELGSARR